MDEQAAGEEIQRLRQEIHEIEVELARLRAERRLFGRSSFSPEWLILRQRSLQTERDRCQSRLRELARSGHVPARLRRAPGRVPFALKAAVYSLTGIVVVLVVMAAYIVMGQGRATPPAAGFAPTPSPTATATASPTATPTPGPTIYKVVPGDTVAEIARRYGLRVEDIVNANKLDNPRLINVGQELIIPPTPVPSPTAAPVPKP